MRNSVLAGLACAVVSLAARAAVAQSASDPCFAGAAFSTDVRVADCTRWIQSGQLSADNLGVAYFNRGIAYEDAHDAARAIADYNHAIRIEPSAGRYKNRGNAYEDTGDFDRAVDDFSHVIQLTPGDAGAWYDRGNAYQDGL
ncbi:MAG TPA: tetratricopeptide repeat protein [Caulobacteraceae bacterium]|jgi:tetratricopeptide (TPR) repeat protein|nr:tetratricopeptide repeat protein [Caulobacteraceae bacterium]